MNPAETDKVNSYQHFVSHPHTYTSRKCLCNTWTLPLTFYLRKCRVFIYKPNINYCPQSAYVILVVIVVVVIMVVFVFVSVFNNKTNVSKYAYVILERTSPKPAMVPMSKVSVAVWLAAHKGDLCLHLFFQHSPCLECLPLIYTNSAWLSAFVSLFYRKKSLDKP